MVTADFPYHVSTLSPYHLLLPTLSLVPTNRANRPPTCSGSSSLCPRPPLQAPVPQEGPCHHEQQLHLQHVPPAPTGQRLWISEQQDCCQSRYLIEFHIFKDVTNSTIKKYIQALFFPFPFSPQSTANPSSRLPPPLRPQSLFSREEQDKKQEGRMPQKKMEGKERPRAVMGKAFLHLV